jgi:hypothetical protein
MESGNVWKLFVKLLWSVLGLLVGDKRSVEVVNRFLQLIIERPNPEVVLDRPAQASVNTDVPADGWAAEWQRFLKDVFGITVDLSGVCIPDDPGGFGWVLFVVKELTYNRVYAKCRELFPSSSYYGYDLESAIIKEKEERTADNGPYAVRFRVKMS